MLFVFNFPKEKLLLFMVIPVPAWLVGVLLIGMNLLGAGGVELPAPGGERIGRVAYDVHLVGVAFAFCYFTFKWNLGRLIPSRLAGGFAGLKKSLKPGPKLRVHSPDDDYTESDAEGDALLDKVNREGMDSLTSREKKALEAYSRRMQQKHR